MTYQVRSVLVTGAGGLIGRAAIRALANDGINVIAHLGPPGAAVATAPPEVTSRFAAIDDELAIAELTAHVDAVVHLAGPPSVARSFEDPVGYARAHVAGTAAVLAGCRTSGVRQLVYISSAEVYGHPIYNPVNEDASLAPMSPYAALKVGAEAMIRAYCASFDITSIVLRPFSVIGPPAPDHSVLGAIVRQAVEGETIELLSPEVVRDFVFVDDVVDAIRAALATSGTRGLAIYNVGTGHGISMRELSETAQQLLGKPPAVRLADGADRPQAADIMELIADTRRISAELGWRARTSMTQALTAVIDDFIFRQSEVARCEP